MGALHVQRLELRVGRLPTMQPTDLYTGAICVDLLTASKHRLGERTPLLHVPLPARARTIE